MPLEVANARKKMAQSGNLSNCTENNHSGVVKEDLTILKALSKAFPEGSTTGMA